MCQIRRSVILLLVFVLAAAKSLRSQEPPGTHENADKPVRIVTLGDSITKGVRSGVTTEQTFAALLEKSLRVQGIAAEVINVGIGGERTDQSLVRLERDVVVLEPALVTIMYGTNDSYVDRGKQHSRISADEYRKNLALLIERLRAAGIKPVLMTPPRWGDAASANGAGQHPNVRLAIYVEQCREAARQLNMPLVDHFQQWTDAVDRGTDIGDWTTDQCHPNPEGHRILAAALAPVVLQQIERKLRSNGD